MRTIARSLFILLLTLPLLAKEPDNLPRNFDVRDDDAKSSVIVKERHLDRHGPKQKTKKDKAPAGDEEG